MPKNIIIVGAGPIGCYTAQVLRTYGYNPLVIEEHDEVGKPIHCTGLVGAGVFNDRWPYRVLSSAKINVINGAVIHYGTQRFVIERKGVACVIDREKFDKDLSKGLNILYRNRFLGLEKSSSGYIVETDNDELFADIIIGADGANSAVRRLINQNIGVKYHKGVQLRIKAKPADKNFVEVYLKYPSFFWVVPESDDVIRVGTISENPYKELQEFLKDTNIKGEILEKFGGLVVTGVCSNTVKDNIALVGDAASQVKPLTYGGIYFGLKAASILTACIKKDSMEDYDKLWKKELESEIKIGAMVKNVYGKLTQAELSKIFKVIKQNKTLIEKVGDFENHSRLILEMIKKPSIYPQIGALFQILFKKII